MIDLTVNMGNLSVEEADIRVTYCHEQDYLQIGGACLEVSPDVLEALLHVLLREIHGKNGEAVSALLDRLPDSDTHAVGVVVPAFQQAAKKFERLRSEFGPDYSPAEWPKDPSPSPRRPPPTPPNLRSAS